MVFFKIKSQIKSPFFNVILKISKSFQNDLKSDFVKSSIKSLNTLNESYKDDAPLMDIYSFPGYQVEIEVPTNTDGSSRQGILDKDLRGKTDSAILEERGVSVYKFLAGKGKLPADDWVEVEDLGMEDNTHPKDVGPFKMTTPAPREKVWLASDVKRTSPVLYSDVDTTTGGLSTSTVRRPGHSPPRGKAGPWRPVTAPSSQRQGWGRSPTWWCGCSCSTPSWHSR
jgi:hypothetical protein